MSKSSHDVLSELNQVEVASLSVRLSRKSEQSGKCHVWHGAVRGDGYGHMRIKKHFVGAHRVAAFLSYGLEAVEAGWVIDHKCCNKLCVNPEHLHRVSSGDNTRLRFLRTGKAIQPRKMRRRLAAGLQLEVAP